jgi:hypothetical protein
VQLDLVAGLQEGEEADPRMAARRGGDQRPVPLGGYEALD